MQQRPHARHSRSCDKYGSLNPFPYEFDGEDDAGRSACRQAVNGLVTTPEFTGLPGKRRSPTASGCQTAMRLNVPQTAAVHPDTRRSDFVRQVAALFDNFCQSAAEMKHFLEKLHLPSMHLDLKESVVE